MFCNPYLAHQKHIADSLKKGNNKSYKPTPDMSFAKNQLPTDFKWTGDIIERK